MSKTRTYQALGSVASRLRRDLDEKDLIFLYAYNRTGKTRLSMDFKEQGKRKNHGESDTLYFNAFTEDLFTWHNDLNKDSNRYFKINSESRFCRALRDLALDESIAGYLNRYADFDFDIDPNAWTVRFQYIFEENIKISRGEEKNFIWCVFMAICERVIDGHESYKWVKYIYIDDPISSLDDNNAVAVACDLAELLRRAVRREELPLKVVVSSHHSLFFNVMCNEISKRKEGVRVKHKRYFLHRPGENGKYMLRDTGDTPYFHHVASLADLQRAANSGELYTYHFNALRSIMEKTAAFFGHPDISFCLKAIDDGENRALFNRVLNLLSHGKYSIHEPTPMGEDNQALFRQILNDFVTRFQFDLPKVLGGSTTSTKT